MVRVYLYMPNVFAAIADHHRATRQSHSSVLDNWRSRNFESHQAGPGGFEFCWRRKGIAHLEASRWSRREVLVTIDESCLPKIEQHYIGWALVKYKWKLVMRPLTSTCLESRSTTKEAGIRSKKREIWRFMTIFHCDMVSICLA